MRWIIRGVAAVALLLALAVAALFLVPADRIAAIAASRLSEATGLEVAFAGGARPSLSPLGVRIDGVVVADPGAPGPPLLTAEALEVSVAPNALFGGEVLVRTVTLVSPRIGVAAAPAETPDTSAGGGASAASQTATSGPDLRALERVHLTDAIVIFTDAESGAPTELGPFDFTLTQASDGTGTLEATLGEAALSATIAGLTEAAAGLPQSVQATLDWPGASVAFDGLAGAGPSFDGTLAVELAPGAAWPQTLARFLPAIPSALTSEGATLSGNVRSAPDTGHALADGVLRIGADRVALDIALVRGTDRPLLIGSVATEAFTLPSDRATPSAPGGSGGAAAPA
ncbi:MAG: hypothetical protein AAF914_10140, partial [Pseudomonadota bacterium]